VSDIETAEVDSLKALDPERPIREADTEQTSPNDRSLTHSGHAEGFAGLANWPEIWRRPEREVITDRAIEAWYHFSIA
jgi:hypothetical protein